MSVEVGTKVWVRGASEDEEDWITAEVIESVDQGNSTKIKVRIDDTQEERNLSVESVGGSELNDIKIRNVNGQSPVEEGSAVEDLIVLTHLHEPSILYTLRERYAENKIYTYTGAILLAINPFFRINIYSDKLLAAYQADGVAKVTNPDHTSELPPHAYAIADNAYNAMAHPKSKVDPKQASKGANQSILVSGESGAGKTETTKIIMQYLATVAGTAAGKTQSEEGIIPLEKQVIQSNPILEAFGNARTVRNDNSSRFGKFIEIQFDKHAKLAGAQVRTFLLEKVRLVRQSENERNYHVFYMLCAGASEQEAADWHLKSIEDYFYTSQSGCFDRRDGIQDKAEYAALREAMNIMTFTDEECFGCLSMSAGLLALGELEFDGVEDRETTGGAAVLASESEGDANNAANTLGVTSEALVNATTTRSIKAGFETFNIKLNPEQANDARDGLVKAVYSALFEWVVGRVNTSIKVASGVTTASFIGLLDIFGFESFQQNGFEQFLINYCNEVLQQQFNDFVFEAEQKEYEKEQILWSFVSFPDNKKCIEMIESRGQGILSLLDEQTVFPNASDHSFSDKIHDQLGKGFPKQFGSTPELKANHCFVVHHYAGSIRYNTVGFLEKNRDKLYPEGVDLLRSSSSNFVIKLVDILTGEGAAAATGGAAAPSRRRSVSSAASAGGGAPPKRRGSVSGGGGSAQVSTASQFRDSLRDLVAQISLTSPHYVRCLKPNDTHTPNAFDPKRIVEQLRYGGVLEAVHVARAGFPVRMSHLEFIQRYGSLASLKLKRAEEKYKSQSSGQKNKSLAKTLLSTVVQPLNEHLGTETKQIEEGDGGGEKVKDKSERYMELEEDVWKEVLGEIGLQLGLTKVFFRQKAFDGIESLRGKAAARAACVIQSTFRMLKAKLLYMEARHDIIIVQKIVRAKQARRVVQAQRKNRAATKIQRVTRKRAAQRPFLAKKRMALKLQTLARMRGPRLKFVAYRQNKAALKIQTRIRVFEARRRWLRVLTLVMFVSCRWRGKLGRRKFKQVRRENRSNAALQEQVSNFQSIMREGEASRRALEARTNEALSLLQAAEYEASQLREQNGRFREELEEKAGAHAETAQALSSLQAKNEELLSQLEKLENASKAQAATAAAVAKLENELKLKEDKLKEAEAARAKQRPYAEAAVKKNNLGMSLDEVMESAETVGDGGKGGVKTRVFRRKRQSMSREDVGYSLDSVLEDVADDAPTLETSSGKGKGKGGKGGRGGKPILRRNGSKDENSSSFKEKIISEDAVDDDNDESGGGGGGKGGKGKLVRKRSISKDSTALINTSIDLNEAAEKLRKERDELMLKLEKASHEAKIKDESLLQAEKMMKTLENEKKEMEEKSKKKTGSGNNLSLDDDDDEEDEDDEGVAKRRLSLSKENDELKNKLLLAEQKAEEAKLEAIKLSEEHAKNRAKEMELKLLELTKQAELSQQQALEAQKYAKTLEENLLKQNDEERENLTALSLMSIEDEEDKHFKILQQNELQELNEEKSKIAEENERKAREQALAAEEAFLKVKKEREELAKAHEAIEHKVASIAEAEELKAANESLQRELEAIKAAQRANSSAALAAVASLDGKKGRRSSSRKSSASGGGSRVRSRSYERVSEKLANEMNDVSLDDGDDYHDGGSDSDDDDRKNRKPSSSSSRSRNKNSKSDMNYPKNGHVMHRGMPTAKCEICGLRIPFDEIEEHSEHCESAIPNNYAPENMNGSTCAIKSKGLLVTVLPSHSSADKFKISVFAGLDANGRTAEKASFKVERTKVKIEGLHNSLIRTLDNDETATDYDFDTSSRTQRLSTAFETASDLIGSFGSTLVGITAGFDSLTSSTTSAPTPQKTPPKNPQQRILDNSPNSIPDLPSLSMSDRSGLCRALERYLIALLELDEKWIELGNNNSFVGIHAMAEEGQVDPAPYIKAHRLLMAFLKDKARS